MIIRNNPETVFQGVNNRKSRAAKQGNMNKWLKLENFSWALFWKAFA